MCLINCDNCNTEFNIKISRISLSLNNFCSNSCRFYFIKHNPSNTANYSHINKLKQIYKNNIEENIDLCVKILSDKTISSKKREIYSKMLMNMNRLNEMNKRR